MPPRLPVRLPKLYYPRKHLAFLRQTRPRYISQSPLDSDKSNRFREDYRTRDVCLSVSLSGFLAGAYIYNHECYHGSVKNTADNDGIRTNRQKSVEESSHKKSGIWWPECIICSIERDLEDRNTSFGMSGSYCPERTGDYDKNVSETVRQGTGGGSRGLRTSYCPEIAEDCVKPKEE